MPVPEIDITKDIIEYNVENLVRNNFFPNEQAYMNESTQNAQRCIRTHVYDYEIKSGKSSSEEQKSNCIILEDRRNDKDVFCKLKKNIVLKGMPCSGDRYTYKAENPLLGAIFVDNQEPNTVKCCKLDLKNSVFYGDEMQDEITENERILFTSKMLSGCLFATIIVDKRMYMIHVNCDEKLEKYDLMRHRKKIVFAAMALEKMFIAEKKVSDEIKPFLENIFENMQNRIWTDLDALSLISAVIDRYSDDQQGLAFLLYKGNDEIDLVHRNNKIYLRKYRANKKEENDYRLGNTYGIVGDKKIHLVNNTLQADSNDITKAQVIQAVHTTITYQ